MANGILITNFADNSHKKALKLVWSSVEDIETNTSTISWYIQGEGEPGLWRGCDKISFIVNNEVIYHYTGPRFRLITQIPFKQPEKTTGGATIEIRPEFVAEGTFIVPHMLDGSKVMNLYLEASIYRSDINCKASEIVELPKIPRGVIITSLPDFNDEENPLIQYSIPNINNTQQLFVELKSKKDEVIVPPIMLPTDKTEARLNFTQANREALQKYSFDSKLKEIKFVFTTIIDNIRYQSEFIRNLSIVNAEPKISYTIVDINPDTIALTGDDQTFVRYHSIADVVVVPTIAKFGTLKSASITNGNETYEGLDHLFSNLTDNIIIMKVTDSRNQSIMASKSLSMINYLNITANLQTTPFLTQETISNLRLNITGKFFNGLFSKDKPNNIQLFYKIKTSSGAYPTEWTIIPNEKITFDGNAYSAEYIISNLDYREEYQVIIKAQDLLEETTKESQIISIKPLFDWGKDSFIFNIPVYVDGMPISGSADSLLESGESNGWSYQKWKSGALIQWRNISNSNYNINSEETGNPNVKIGETISVDYPIPFTAPPVITLTGGDVEGKGITPILALSTPEELLTMIKYKTKVYFNTDDTNTKYIRVSVLALGRWKR